MVPNIFSVNRISQIILQRTLRWRSNHRGCVFWLGEGRESNRKSRQGHSKVFNGAFFRMAKIRWGRKTRRKLIEMNEYITCVPHSSQQNPNQFTIAWLWVKYLEKWCCANHCPERKCLVPGFDIRRLRISEFTRLCSHEGTIYIHRKIKKYCEWKNDRKLEQPNSLQKFLRTKCLVMWIRCWW